MTGKWGYKAESGEVSQRRWHWEASKDGEYFESEKEEHSWGRAWKSRGPETDSTGHLPLRGKQAKPRFMELLAQDE